MVLCSGRYTSEVFQDLDGGSCGRRRLLGFAEGQYVAIDRVGIREKARKFPLGRPRLSYRIGPLALAAVLGLAGLNGCAGFSGVPPSRPITLTLLHTNDTHSHLEPFPRDVELSAGNQGPQQGGIARRKTLIDAVRVREPHVLLLDAGDNFQGTIFYNAWKGSAEIMALNALGYDAVTLGNHEFDLGAAELAGRCSASR